MKHIWYENHQEAANVQPCCALCMVTLESWAHSKVAKGKDWHLCFCWVHGLLTHRNVQKMEKAHRGLLGWEASSSHPSGGVEMVQSGIFSLGNITGVGTFTVPQVQLRSCQGSGFNELHYQLDFTTSFCCDKTNYMHFRCPGLHPLSINPFYGYLYDTVISRWNLSII